MALHSSNQVRTQVGSSVINRLFTRYYTDGQAITYGASSHWETFSRQFRVNVDCEGVVQGLIGRGFGGSQVSGFASRALGLAGNWLHVRMLRMPNLSSNIGPAKAILRKMQLYFSADAFRQVCTDCFIGDALKKERTTEPSTILLIGDGHGILSALLHTRFPSARIFLVDLGATLLFQAAYLGRTFPSATHALADEDSSASQRATFSYCPSDRIEHLPKGDIDLAVNVASMQEMTPRIVADYFRLLRERRTKLFYCCNRLEKRLPAGELLRFMDYPWSPDDLHLVDEACPWHQWFLGRSEARHVSIGGMPVPFMHRYDGVHWHRLTRLAKAI